MKTSRKISVTIVVIALAFFLYTNLKFASASPSSTSSGPVINVSINDDSFNPQSIVIGSPNSTSGEFATVIWTNNGGLVHTVTSGAAGTPDGLFDSGSLSPGANFTLEVNETMYASILAKYSNGTVQYYCSFHFTFGMVGEVTVSTTVVPEFSPTTYLLTIAMILPLLFIAARSKRVLGYVKRLAA